MSCRFTLRPLSICLALLVATSAGFAKPPAASETVRVKGSDTIGGALGPDLAEAYHRENPATALVWEALGSSTGFAGLFDGSADLAASSRPISEAEQAEAQRRGLQLREWVIAYDGIVVLVHPTNPLPALTLEQVARIFQGRITNFREVGGPDRRIELVARPSYSGTHAFFKEKVVRRGNAKGPEEFAPSTLFLEHSAEIVARVAADPGAISFLGLGWVRPEVRAVPIAAGKSSAPKSATVETIRDGSYPIFRPLFLYSLGVPRGEVQNLLAYILSEAGQRQVTENGFVRTDAPAKLAYRPALSASEAPAAVAAAAAPLVSRSPLPGSPAPARLSEPTSSNPAQLIRVFFASGGARIADAAELRIAEAARRLAGSGQRAQVVGHADANGSKAANDRISAARATAVRQELVRLGVPPERLSISARGADEPIRTNETLEGRQDNRRVDILILGDETRKGG